MKTLSALLMFTMGIVCACLAVDSNLPSQVVVFFMLALLCWLSSIVIATDKAQS